MLNILNKFLNILNNNIFNLPNMFILFNMVDMFNEF